MQKLNPGNSITHDVNLSQCLFDKWASWKVLATDEIDSILGGQLKIKVHSPKDVRLIWKADYGARPNPEHPTVTELAIPLTEIYGPDLSQVKQTAWKFKSQLLNDFLSTENISRTEPIKSPILKTYAERGYQIVSMSNAYINEGTVVNLNLAPTASLSNLEFTVNTLLRSKELNLENVHFKNCKIEFDVNGGTWKNCKASGDQSHFIGSLGATSIDERTFLTEVFLDANCLSVKFGGNLKERIKGVTVRMSLMPPEVMAITHSMTEEECRLMRERIAQAKYIAVPCSKLTIPTDSMGSQTAHKQFADSSHGRV